MKFTFPLVELDEVCSIKGGKRLPKGEELIEIVTQHPYIRARDIGNGKINFTDPVYITDQTYQKISRYIVSKGDVIITIVGANIGDIAYVEEEFKGANLTENAVKLTAKENMIPKYLKYALTPSYMKGYFQTVASGAAQGKLGLYKIKKVQIPKPPLPTQQKIARILSAYDNLIENNLKRIKLLEEMAQITYEQWFVRMKFPGHETTPMDAETGLPEGWKKGRVIDLFELQRGFDLPSHAREEGDIPILASTGIAGFHSSYKVEGPGVITGRSGTIGKAIYVHTNFWPLNTSLWVKRYNSCGPLYVKHFIECFFLQRLGGGSAVPSLDRKAVHVQKITIPSPDIMNKFECYSSVLYRTIRVLSSQNQLLNEARDILLPRLMIGIIDVDQIELPDIAAM